MTSTYGLNLGLLANDLTRLASPVVVNKITKHAPVLINIKSDLGKSIKIPHIQTLTAPSTKFKFTEMNSLMAKTPTRKFRSVNVPVLPLVPLFVLLMPNINSLLPIFPSAFGRGSALNRNGLNKRRLLLK